MILETVCVGPTQANCYILASARNSPAIIIDPGAEESKIKKILDKHSFLPAFIINTHGHYDHIGCDDKFDVPVYIHSKDSALLKDPNLNLSGLFALPYQLQSDIRVLEDQDTLELQDLRLKVIHIPGHTPGGIALLMQKPTEKILFTGDSLFCQGIGRSDLAGGDESLLIKSIKERLLTLPGDTIIYPGHGPSSTIAEEKRSNPFLT
jgi:glyoxylase-like metal-dependent hydrolase (beta-lactamase superfamily II)